MTPTPTPTSTMYTPPTQLDGTITGTILTVIVAVLGPRGIDRAGLLGSQAETHLA